MKLAALRRLAADRDVEIVIDDDARGRADALREAGFAVLQATWATSPARQGRDPAPGPGGAGPDLTKPDRRPGQPARTKPCRAPRRTNRRQHRLPPRDHRKGTGRMSPTTACRRWHHGGHGPPACAARGPDPDAGPARARRPAAAGSPAATAPAFELLYDRVASSVFGVIRRVLRDPAQSEEVAQEVLVEVWRTATRFDARARQRLDLDPHHGAPAGDRPGARRRRPPTTASSGSRSATTTPPYDEVADTVETRLEQEQVRRCLEGLTDLQRESVTLAYYGGHTYREVAELLDVPLGTVKTRMRDGLIRLRDCLGVMA